MSPEERQPRAGRQNDGGLIQTLSAVVHLGSRNDAPFFLGWTEAGLPALTQDESQLSETARQSFNFYRRARLPLRRLPFTALAAVDFRVAEPPVDYRDSSAGKAEDILRYRVIDRTGEELVLSFGELDILEAICASTDPWQNLSEGPIRDVAVATQPMYTTFAPLSGGRSGRAIALLFKPALAGDSNEALFKAFVRRTLTNLLILDESQPSRGQKGYIRAAARIAGKGGSLSSNFEAAAGGLKAGALRLLRGLGLYHISDGELEEMARYRPFYDISALELPQLFELADEMRRSVRVQFGRD